MLARYARWLHTGWPAGQVERMPVVGDAGATSVPGLRLAGDLAGVPLLKLALDGAVRSVRAFRDELGPGPRGPESLDLVIVGAGAAGLAAAVEARACGLTFELLEAARPFETVHDFPARKPIFTYPRAMVPEGAVQVAAGSKEELLAELEGQREAHAIEVRAARVERVTRRGDAFDVRLEEGPSLRARRVLLAVGRSGDHRRLGVPGGDRPEVMSRLFDPSAYRGRAVVVVGGGDSACEAALALAAEGARVTLVHRGHDLARAKHENAEAVEHAARDRTLTLRLGTTVTAVGEGSIAVATGDRTESLPQEVVFTMLGREPPLALLRRSGIAIRGDVSWGTTLTTAVCLALAAFVYLWKGGGVLTQAFEARGWFPFGLTVAEAGASGPMRVLQVSLREPGFWYSATYSSAVLGFGAARVRRRATPYVSLQTLTLAVVQVGPLFLLPYVLLPLLGHAGLFDSGVGRSLADALFPEVSYGHGREYWRAFGLVLAWPLFVWNVFTERPMGVWLLVSCLQTFVILPWIVRRWGKGAYCGWLCSCGALAETLGDTEREKMPHGPGWNRLNLVGQLLLGLAFAMLLARVSFWLFPHVGVTRMAMRGARQALSGFAVVGVPLDWVHVVDLLFAGILGVGLYTRMSGRVWCRFACPLAALMHVYHRAFGLFRIFADAKKCISCGRCTSVCHQGIDVMAFAQRGTPMADPQCVRCSACVQACPTGVLAFGRLAEGGSAVLDGLSASLVRTREDGKRGLTVLR